MTVHKEQKNALSVDRRRRFAGFSLEAERAVREMRRKSDKKLGQIINSYEGFAAIADRLSRVSGGPLDYEVHEYRWMISRAIMDLELTDKDIEKASLAFRGRGLEHLGLFFSALTEIADQPIIRIHPEESADYLGFRNTRRVDIVADAGDFFGVEIESGQLHLKGSCGIASGGCAKGGAILIGGNVSDEAGYCMEGGILHIKGSAGHECGMEMENGIIIIEGNAGDSLGIRMQKDSHGMVFVFGNAGKDVGESAEGGMIFIGGNCESIAKSRKGCIIYAGGKEVE